MLFVQALDLILLVMSDVAADEHAAERHRGAQHNETAGGRIDDRSPSFVTARSAAVASARLMRAMANR